MYKARLVYKNALADGTASYTFHKLTSQQARQLRRAFKRRAVFQFQGEADMFFTDMSLVAAIVMEPHK